MSNASAHALGTALTAGLAHVAHELRRNQAITAAPFGTAILGSLMGSLPDLIEPATNPHHRQFFHGLLFAAAVAYVTKQLYDREAVEPRDQLIRYAGLLIGGCYLTHLAMDFCTRRSLPLVGRL